MSTKERPSVLVEVTGSYRSGIGAKSQKPWTMFEGFVWLPGCPYPQRAEFYAETPQQVPQVGTYECLIVLSIKDGRVSSDIDPRNGTRVSVPAPASKAAV